MKRVAVLTAFVLVSMFAAVAPPGTPTQAQAGCFPETGFCITNQQFAEYFRLRGGVRIMGYPISRSFTLDGFEVQFFQRVILQMQGGQVARMNILDPNVMPMTRANQSVFPGPDPAIAARAPQVGASDYAQQVVSFVKSVAPDTFNGQNVGFFNLFNTTVPVDIAFAGQTPNPDLVTLLNLEIWGLPTSNPAADPGNGGFIYQRFQRGIMHYQATSGATEGILVGEYLKAVITGKSLPSDLAADMAGSRFNGQYSPGSPGWTARPAELPGTDMTNAFEQGSGNVTPPPAPATTVPAAGTATPTAVAGAVGPTVTIQVDDELIDPGQSVSVTVIARYGTPIDWIEFDGIESENNNENDNDASDDAQLTRMRFDCDDRTECANVWTISPTVPSRYTLRARARGTDDVRSEWVTIPFRVRDNGSTATPVATGTAAATATPAATSAAPSAPTSAATATPAATTAAATPTATRAP